MSYHVRRRGLGFTLPPLEMVAGASSTPPAAYNLSIQTNVGSAKPLPQAVHTPAPTPTPAAALTYAQERTAYYLITALMKQLFDSLDREVPKWTGSAATAVDRTKQIAALKDAWKAARVPFLSRYTVLSAKPDLPAVSVNAFIPDAKVKQIADTENMLSKPPTMAGFDSIPFDAVRQVVVTRNLKATTDLYVSLADQWKRLVASIKAAKRWPSLLAGAPPPSDTPAAKPPPPPPPPPVDDKKPPTLTPYEVCVRDYGPDTDYERCHPSGYRETLEVSIFDQDADDRDPYRDPWVATPPPPTFQEPLPKDEDKKFPWLWVGVGATVLGGGALLLWRR